MKRKVRAVLPHVLLIIIGPRLYFQSVFILQFSLAAITNFGARFIQAEKPESPAESDDDFSTIDFAKDS